MNRNRQCDRLSHLGEIQKDPRMAHRLGECYDEELQSIAAYIYRSVMTEGPCPETSALFDALAREEIRHFRCMGELILALGGNPVVHTPVRVDPLELPEDISSRLLYVLPRCLRESIREEQSLIDRYETLLGRSSDRTVRGLLAEFVADEQRHITLLTAQLETLNC